MKYAPYLERFTFASDIIYEDNEDVLKNFNLFIYDLAQFGVEDNIDKSVVIAKLENELSKINSEIERGNKMLNNPNFVSKAPANKVQEEKDKLANYLNKKLVLEEKIAKLK